MEREQSQSYYLILDAKGIHSAPIPPPPPFPAIFLPARGRIPIAEDASRFGKLELIGQQDLVLKALQVIEPRLRRLAVVVVGEVPVIHGDIGLGRLIPLPLMGEGMARLTSLVLAIANTPKGVVLVDEIENGLHHSVLPKYGGPLGKPREHSTLRFLSQRTASSVLWPLTGLSLRVKAMISGCIVWNKSTISFAL
ncbi:AAA family ATPase [Methanothrix sp.]|uniref:AAA family ATPase n=1 Tax=Methanothrix sp. TaxID=90426 RepID=UPI003C768744